MHKDPKEAKENIVQAISVLRSVNDKRPHSYLLRTFFDAKSNEIQTIFSDGPSVDIAQLIDNLNRIAPTKRKEWGEIRFSFGKISYITPEEIVQPNQYIAIR